MSRYDAIARALAGNAAAASERDRMQAVLANAQAQAARLRAGIDAPDEPLRSDMLRLHQEVARSAARVLADMTPTKDLT